MMGVWVSASAAQDSVRSTDVAQAEELLSRGMTEQAANVLTAHLRREPSDVNARLLLAEALLKLGQKDSAEDEYQAVLKGAPNNYIALAQLGTLYESAGKLDQAEPMLARAVKHSNGEPQLRVEWAAVLARLHRFQEASRALSGVPAPASMDNRMVFFRLKAAVAAGEGNASAAASDMESALAVHPEDAPLQLATAAAEASAHNWKRAAALASSVFETTKNPAAGLLLLEAQLGMNDDVRSTLASLHDFELPSEHADEFHQRLAELLISHGHFADATEDLKQAVELDPKNADVMFDLALAEFKAGQAKEALDTAQKCKVLRDSAELEDLLGDIDESAGDNLSAVRSYQAAVSLAPNDENYRISLAVELLQHENFEPAKVVLTQAENLFPKSWRILVALGMLQYFVGTKESSSQIMLRASELAPRPQTVLEYLGDVEMDESSPPDAAAIARLCGFADAHPAAAREQFYCGALEFDRDYVARDTTHATEIVRRLTIAAKALAKESGPHCELGRADAWLERWQPALYESQLCAQLDPDSAQAHYRLAQLYHRMGQTERWRQQLELHRAAAERLADENEQRQKTRNTFIYKIRSEASSEP
jgi:Flp pilus assembly protein TadD